MSIKFKAREFLRSLGPGLITAALVFGPGSLTISSKLGAKFGFELLWIFLMTTLFMIAFVTLTSKIGLKLDTSLMRYIGSTYGKLVSGIVGMGIFLISASFQAGNSIGAGVAFAELFGTSPAPWVVVFSFLAASMLFFKSFYAILEKVMIGMVGVMLLSFLITSILAKPDPIKLLGSLVPTIPDGSEILLIALIASSFSIVGAFYQSYLVQEKGWHADDKNKCVRESATGIIILGLISTLIMICAGTVLHEQGIEVVTASDMGKALKPLFGDFTSSIFMVGLFAASFSSIIGNATIGGSILADTFSLGHNLSSIKVRALIMLVIFIGAAIAIAFGNLPLELIVFAQGITIIIVPLIAVILILIGANKKLMGSLKNGMLLNTITITGLILLVAIAIANIKLIFFS